MSKPVWDKYQLYAVGHYLSDWPENLSFDDLMESMRQDGENIWAWELVEAVPLEDLAGLIEDMINSLRSTFK